MTMTPLQTTSSCCENPTVYLFLTSAGGGKTAHAITRIRQRRAADPFAPIWVILPNFPQVNAFRHRLAQAGGALGVEIGTFYRLYAEILARAGAPAPRLFEPVQHRLLRAIVDRLCAEGRLHHYAPLRDKPGFIRALRTLIQELKRARVHREPFTAALADQPPRLRELAAIYAAYQDWLVSNGWTDAEGQGWLAALALERNPDLYADLSLLVVDGFDEFNPTQLEVLRLLATRAAETLITLTGDPDRPHRTAHRRFARALTALTTALPNLQHVTRNEHEGHEESTKYATRNTQHAIFQHLESNLFEPTPTSPPADSAVEFIEARDRRQEVRAALRWLKARIVQDGMAPHEVALLARDLGPYRPFLEETAAEFGLPLHLAVGADLLSNPAVAALLSLLSLPVLDWPRRPVVEALSSPYFDWSASLTCSRRAHDSAGQEAGKWGESLSARLDAVARAGLVISGLTQWYEAFDRLVAAAPEAGAATEEEDITLADVPIGEEAAALRRFFERFVARLTPPPQATVREYVAWVEGLIGDDPELAPRYPAPTDDSLRVVVRAREPEQTPAGRYFARRDVAALRAFKDVLRGLVLAESLLSPPFALGAGGGSASPPLIGEGPGVGSSYERFYNELRGAVEAATYKLPPPEEGGILVAPVLHARGLSFRAVALLGLSEGEFPATEQEGPLLREDDRSLLRQRGLPLEPRLRGEEVTLFYEAITRARERLLLCRPYLAEDGQQWEPSPYWRHLRQLVEAPQRLVRPEEITPEDAASPQEFIAAVAQAGLAPVSEGGSNDDYICQGWQAALAGAEVVQARLAGSPTGPHEGDLSALSATLASRYGPAHVWSSSSLETYAKCPLHFYLAYVLYLEPRLPPQEGFDRLILGSIYHRVLEEVYRSSPDAPLAILREVAERVFAAAPAEYGFRPSPLWEQQQREFLQVLEKTILALEEAREEYEPYAQELSFGLRDRPPLIIRHSTSSIQMRGYIDRVDRAPDGSLRVVDYKTGSSPISPRELEEGTRLQLPLYAQAVQDALRLGAVTDGFYWHIGSARPSYLRLGQYEGGVSGAIEQAIAHVLAYVAAVREGRFPPTPPARGCPDHCPAVGFCWRYRPREW